MSCWAIGGGGWAWGSGVGWESFLAAMTAAVVSGVFSVGSIEVPENHAGVRVARRPVSVSEVGACDWSAP